MAGVRIKFGFIPLPLDVIDDADADLSLGEYRLLSYLLRHQFRVKTEVLSLSNDELLNGVWDAQGNRRDRGCRITSQRDLRAAREALEARGWITVETTTKGTLYQLHLASEDEEEENKSGDKMHPLAPAATSSPSKSECKMHPPAGAKCTGNRVQNAPTLSGQPVEPSSASPPPKKVEKVIRETTPPPMAAGGDQATPDRRDAVRSAILEHQAKALQGSTVWSPPADKALLALLRDYPEPEWTAQRLVLCVRNRFSSDLDAAELPQAWLASLPTFVSGPKDRYKRGKSVKSAAKVLPMQGKFATAAVCLIESEGKGREITEATAQRIKEHMRSVMAAREFSMWIDPLIFGFVKSSGIAIVLAPNTDWDGMQEKFTVTITEAIAKNGLTNGFELWCMSANGDWVKPSAVA